MNFTRSGMYIVSANSTVGIIVFIYNTTFKHSFLSSDQWDWAWNNEEKRFKLEKLVYFNATYKYILVLAAYNAWHVGPLFITTRGVGNVFFSEYIFPGMP
jgi:hypothetical protein